MEQTKLKGKFDLPQTNWDISELTWDVVYQTIENGIIITKRVPLNPNQYSLAKVDEECEFNIISCPNLHNGGEWEEMAVVMDGSQDRIKEVTKKLESKELFKRLNNHAREDLSSMIKLPEPIETWEEIFEIQARKDGANYSMLKEWLKKNYEIPKKKINEK